MTQLSSESIWRYRVLGCGRTFVYWNSFRYLWFVKESLNPCWFFFYKAPKKHFNLNIKDIHLLINYLIMWQKYVTHYHCLLKCYTEETANFSYILVHEGWYLQPFFGGGGSVCACPWSSCSQCLYSFSFYWSRNNTHINCATLCHIVYKRR